MARKYLQTKKTTLSYSISDSEVTLQLDELLKLNGDSVSASDLGDKIYFTIDPGTSKEEICSTTSAGVTVNSDGTVTVTAVRGLQEISPYSTGGFASDHGTGATVVFSNNPQLYNELANLFNDNTYTGLNTFSGQAPRTTVDPTNGNDLTRLSYIQALVLGTLTTIDVKVPGTAGETIVDGDLIYLKSSDNRWWKADADDATTVNNVLLGIAQGAGAAAGQIPNGVLLQGVDDAQSGLTGGTVMYASNTAGDISSTPGTVEVTVGVAKSTTELYFAPRFNQMITEDQQDAMAGTSGTTPSASNKFVDNADTTGTGLVLRASAVNSIYNSTFGDGNDGDVTISAGTTTLSRDMYYNNLTIQTGGILNPTGYRVFVKGTLTFEGTGKIARNGNAGGNGGNGTNGSAGAGGAGGAAGTAGAALAAGNLAGGNAGTAGAAGSSGTDGGATPGGGGGNASAPSNVTSGVGTAGVTGTGASGAGGSGFNGVSGGAAANGIVAGGTVTNPLMMPRTVELAIMMHYFSNTTFAYMNGSAGAAGGSGGGGGAGGNQGAGTAGGGGGGGGGGAGGCGGIVVVAANTIVGGYATCIQALGGAAGNGGNGGNGSASHAGSGGGGGGGNGGTGGVVAFVYHTYSGTALTTACVAGGALGTGGTPGTPGTGGGTGGSGSSGATGATGKLYSIAI